MATLNSIPVMGTTLLDLTQQQGISFDTQEGREDNQGTAPVPFTSNWSFQYGAGYDRPESSREGAAYQGSYGSLTVLGNGGGAGNGGGGSRGSEPMIP